MGKLGTNFKVCQTCRYWGGQRNINGLAKLVEELSETGKCCNPSSFYNQEMSKRASCSHHEPVV